MVNSFRIRAKLAINFGVEVDVDKLKDLRRRNVLTIVELAKDAGVSKNTISRAERGGNVHPSSIRKIANALHVEPQELVK